MFRLRPPILCLLLGFSALCPAARAAEPVQVNGIYPGLATFNNEGECGTGAVVPWADRLWVISYAPHQPKGSSDKLYEITPDLRQVIRSESIGGTPANRMIHTESRQLFIGPYAIDDQANVRVIPYAKMFGRHTGLARHLTDPAGKIVFATMEEGIYEVDVKTLEPKELWGDEQVKSPRKADLPGYHGKGFYSSQGRYVYANNGDHAAGALSNPDVPSGVLAEWDGKADKWTVVRRNQFTEVTGPGGINGSAHDAPLWSVGWDHRSLILMLLDGGRWTSFRLPKASHCYDGAHGWNTEWPRIRDIAEDSLLMTMHGSFWKFPKTFSASNTAGIAPRSTYLKVIGDFAPWGGRVVLGCDDTAKSEFLNKDPLKGDLGAPGQSQSNLWFVNPSQLDHCGPLLGRGAVWQNDDVKAGETSDPFLFSGYTHRSLHLSHGAKSPVAFTLEVDPKGTNQWTVLKVLSVPAGSGLWTQFPPAETGVWLRLTPVSAAGGVTAMFNYRGSDDRAASADPLCDGLAGVADKAFDGLLQTRGGQLKTLTVASATAGGYELTADLKLVPNPDPTSLAFARKSAAIEKSLITSDAASVIYDEGKGKRWRLPKGDPAFEKEIREERVCREVCTERNLLNTHGTFYELPALNAGGFAKIRPVATHNRRITDYASYRGLLVMTGVAYNAKGGRVIRSDDGKAAVWTGVVDDLWSFGKPRGEGGPWKDTAVRAGAASDPYLATGYDKKSLTLSHTGTQAVTFTIEADFTGTGDWRACEKLTVPAGQPVAHQFPAAFSAYWLRLKSDQDTTATATFRYE